MFDNSVSVLSRAVARIKRIVTIAELVIQLMFIGYYAYLLVVNHDDIVFLIAYSILIFIAAVIFFVMIFTLDPYQKRAIAFKKKTRKYARIISWTGKLMVISYNIYRLVAFGMTETGQLLLIFSIIIFLGEVALFVVSSISVHFIQLFIYSLQMDYQNIIGEKEEISEKPIGRILLAANNNNNYEEDVNKLFVEHEIYEEVKKYATNELHANIKRRKLEKQLLRYYDYTLDYYQNNNDLTQLFDDIEILGLDKKEYAHLYVLQFFLINYIEQVYVGLNLQYMRFVLCGLSHFRDYKSAPVVDMIYHIVIKHLYKNNKWDKPINEENEKKSIIPFIKKENKESNVTLSKKMYQEVSNIISNSIEEYEEELNKTIGGEIGSIVTDTIKKKVHGSVKKKFKGMFKRKKQK